MSLLQEGVEKGATALFYCFEGGKELFFVLLENLSVVVVLRELQIDTLEFRIRFRDSGDSSVKLVLTLF